MSDWIKKKEEKPTWIKKKEEKKNWITKKESKKDWITKKDPADIQDQARTSHRKGGRTGFSEGGGKDSGKTGEAKSKAVLQNMKLERKFPKTSTLLKKAGVIKKASGGRIGYKVGGAAKRGVSNILRKK